MSSLKITVFAPGIFFELISELVFSGFPFALSEIVENYFSMIESVVATLCFSKNKSFVYNLQNHSLNHKSACVRVPRPTIISALTKIMIKTEQS